MADKPQITATIKFRGVTIENMTVDELKALRDVINQLVGKDVERVTEHHYHDLVYRPRPYEPIWITNPVWTVSSSTFTAGNSTFTVGNSHTSSKISCDSNEQHYTVSLN